MGRYDLMMKHTCVSAEPNCALLNDGIFPFHDLQLGPQFLGWVEDSMITTNVRNLRVRDVRHLSLAKTYEIRIPGLPSQVFVIANHQGTTIYDQQYHGTGLLITHILRSQGEPVAWDIESRVGKQPNTGSGKDSLDASSTPVRETISSTVWSARSSRAARIPTRTAIQRISTLHRRRCQPRWRSRTSDGIRKTATCWSTSS